MPTICPNCLRPLRSGAKYCGYCGSNLNPAAPSDSASMSAVLEGNAVQQKPPDSPQARSSGGKGRRTLLIILIILLCLVLLAAFSVYYLRLIG